MMSRTGYIASAFVLLYTVMCGVQVEAACNTEPTVFDCDRYNPLLCHPDSQPFCLTNGTKVSSSCEAKQAVCLEHAYIDDTNMACDPTATTAAYSQENLDCCIYNATGRCTHDLLPFCLTNGTMVFGTCSALKAVCHERAHIDDTGLLCPVETTESACVSYNAFGRCTHDLVPYCLTNGTRIFGTCSLLQAICHEDADLDETEQLCPTISEFSDLDCVSYNRTANCLLLDHSPFCLNNGTIIHGKCTALKAVCHENAYIDETGQMCLGKTTEDACVIYDATGRCTHDLLPFCLTNGTMVLGTCSALQAVCHEHAYIDESGLLCPDTCAIYNATSRCTHDLFPFCLTNGTMVFGTCSALKAVCHEHVYIDNTGHLCPGETTEDACVSYSATGRCTHDLLPFCLTNGTMVLGTCSALKAVCHEHAYIDESGLLCQESCAIYNATSRCTSDLLPFCLTNGTMVFGTCSALQAVCHERANMDNTGHLCPGETTEDACVSYSATGRCTHDLLPFCLTNGTMVFGTCSALQAVCHEHAYIDESGLLCPGKRSESCAIYNATSRCTSDLLPFCLTNGTMVFGTCSALQAVCHERANIDNTGHLCPGETAEGACASYSATGRCTHDLLPFCLTNGTVVFGTCSALQAVCHEHAYIDESGLLCPGKSSDTCAIYNATSRCTHDLFPFCLTNGTMVFGRCSALKAVCHEHANIDNTGHLCRGETTDVCVSYSATGRCTHDLLPFCLTNGTMVFGTCSALQAVCHEHAYIDESGLLCPGKSSEDACVSYNATGRCTHDLLPFCLTNGTMVFGRCSALKAVCQEHAHIDDTGYLCPRETTDACVSYSATGRCTHDLLPFCLTNGTMVFGTCSALQAVCHEHAYIDESGLLCPGKSTEDACVSYIATSRCTHDLLPFCLTNGTMVFGTCSALKAVCHEHAHIDDTGYLCPRETTESACVSYNAFGRCTHDLLPYCLTNGTRIFGTCSLLQAICHEHATEGSCEASAATSLLMSTFVVVTLIAMCVICWDIMK